MPACACVNCALSLLLFSVGVTVPGYPAAWVDVLARTHYQFPSPVAHVEHTYDQLLSLILIIMIITLHALMINFPSPVARVLPQPPLLLLMRLPLWGPAPTAAAAAGWLPREKCCGRDMQHMAWGLQYQLGYCMP